MTVITTNTFDGPFTPNGITTEFPFSFAAVSADDVAVVSRSTLGIDTPLAGYTVKLGNLGGSIVFPVAPLNGADPIYILSNPSFEQQADFKNQGAWSPGSVNDALDRSAIRDLFLKSKVDGLEDTVGSAVSDIDALQEAIAAVEGLSISVTGSVNAATRAALAWVPINAGPVFLTEVGLEGGYIFDSSNLTAEVTADAVEINYIAPHTDTTGASGAWVRIPQASLHDQTERLSYGQHAKLRTVRETLTALSTLHSQIVGFAAYAGITGGHAYSAYYVNDPSLDESAVNSFGWALAQAKAAGGGQIYFDPMGQFNIVLSDALQFGTTDSNLTVYAAGLNVTIWCDRLKGAINSTASNHIWWGICFRPLPGPINGTAIGLDTSTAKSIVNIRSDYSDKTAFAHCEFRRPSWHCLDIASVTSKSGASLLCRATVQNCIFWDSIQGHLIGTNNSQFSAGTFTDDSSVRQTFVTFYECVWAYNLQRNPKVLGNGYVDMANCYTILTPYETEYVDGTVQGDGGVHTYTELQTSAFGGGVQEGGWLNVRGCLFQSAHSEVDGLKATQLITNGYSGNTGQIVVADSAAENALTFDTRISVGLTALPYTLAHDPVPGAGSDREDWVARRWAAAGARPDAAPAGAFVWTSDTSLIPNGETVLIDRGRIGQYRRSDNGDEYPSARASNSLDLDASPRGSTRIVGRALGKSTGATIGATALDLAGLSTNYFSVQGDGGAADVRFIMSSVEAIQDGLLLRIAGSSTVPVTLKSALSINVSAVDTTLDQMTVTGHGMTTGNWPIYFTSTVSVPTGLTASQAYYAIVIDANTLKLATSYANAVAGTAVDLLDVGSGTITAHIGSLNLPNGADMLLNSSSKVAELVWDSSNFRFNVISRHRVQTADITDYGTAAIGYVAGAGGAVTQATSKSTTVTLNKLSGQITMNAASLAAAAVVSFTLNNSFIGADDDVRVRVKSGNASVGSYRVASEGNAVGSRIIVVENKTAGALAEALVLGISVFKGSVS